jgi:hypothetical protein
MLSDKLVEGNLFRTLPTIISLGRVYDRLTRGSRLGAV